MFKKLKRLVGLAPPPKHGNRRQFLLDLLPKNSVGAEIGVHRGDFSEQLLRVLTPRELHLIDPWKHYTQEQYAQAWYGGKSGGQAEMDQRYQAVCARFEAQTRAGQVKIHRAPSGEALATLTDEHLDWVYIDGNHLYEFVREDLELAFRKTRPGGYITGDDYKEGGWWKGGVKRAVDEFVKNHPVKLEMVRNEQFVLRK